MTKLDKTGQNWTKLYLKKSPTPLPECGEIAEQFSPNFGAGV
jgi:hypothetical protein